MTELWRKMLERSRASRSVMITKLQVKGLFHIENKESHCHANYPLLLPLFYHM